HLKTKRVPATVLKVEIRSGFVVRRVPSVEAGQPDNVAAPAAGHPSAKRIADRKRHAGEEIISLLPDSLQAHLVVSLRKWAGPGNARHGSSGTKHDGSILDANRAAP